jgi:ribosomal protein S4E
MLRCADLVKTDVSEERIASVIRGTKIGELGTILAVTSNRSSVPHGVKIDGILHSHSRVNKSYIALTGWAL